MATGEHSKLAADRTNHFAAGLGADPEGGRREAGAGGDGRGAGSLQQLPGRRPGDYAHDLPGADKPLVTPAHAMTRRPAVDAEQKELLSDYGAEVEVWKPSCST